jgi:glutathione S-transferase
MDRSIHAHAQERIGRQIEMDMAQTGATMTSANPSTPTLTIFTYDWVPAGSGKGPRGFVRDLRLRWALEEAGLAYEVRTTPFKDRGAEHFARQPFGQVPFLEDGEVRVFESGACLLHIAKKSESLMPRDPVGEAETLEWVIAALNSVEMVTVPWWFLKISGNPDNALTAWMRKRLDHLHRVLSEREWLAASRFTVADLLMADVLRIPDLRAELGSPVLEAYVARLCSRPAFEKALADQLAHFAAAD